MAGGTATGLNGVPRTPGQDPRTRRALQRFSGTNLVAQTGGVQVNQTGQLDTNATQVFAQLVAYEAAHKGLVGTL